ncbi:hypothetical protein JHK84_043247 [Glycine max]|nr:hypothetical protein JHK86_043058 [Glycine max]KAG5117134.1 hypothetical protein JHK84_043247 [Glycine max]
MAPRVSSSQSTMSFVPSASMEPISGWTVDNNRMAKPNRSIYEPDIGGGTSTNLFQSPSIPSVKPALAANAKFFVPTAAPSSNEQTMEAIVEIKQEDNIVSSCECELGSNSAYGAYGSYSLGRSSTEAIHILTICYEYS